MCPPLSSTMIHWASLPTAAVEEPLVEKLKINLSEHSTIINNAFLGIVLNIIMKNHWENTNIFEAHEKIQILETE